jgi:myo-inositol-1(or 4)-monophosphatase
MENIDTLKREILKVALKAADAAAQHAAKLRQNSSFTVNLKGVRDLVTEADLQCERIIIDNIKKAFPDHKIMSEESSPTLSEDLSKGPLWVIDPIDGTTNFAHGHVHVGISIGFAYDGLRQVGVVNCPFLSEVYTATRNGGAFCNDKKIKVSSATKAEDAIICTGLPYQREYTDGVIKRMTGIVKEYRDLRRLGAASVDLCWIACGKLDGFYEDLCPWDVAAGLLIASEAGAFIGRFTEATSDYLAWPRTNGPLPDEIDGTNIIACTPGIAKALFNTLA